MGILGERFMGRDRDFRSFVVGYLLPLFLMLGGGGLLFAARGMDSPAVGISGFALLGIGLLWIIVSCFRDGIDFFDL